MGTVESKQVLYSSTVIQEEEVSHAPLRLLVLFEFLDSSEESCFSQAQYYVSGQLLEDWVSGFHLMDFQITTG